MTFVFAVVVLLRLSAVKVIVKVSAVTVTRILQFVAGGSHATVRRLQPRLQPSTASQALTYRFIDH